MSVSPGNSRVRVVAIAAMVAAMVEISDATEAMVSDRIEASITWSLCQAETYQRQENPSQIAIEVPALKE